MEEKNKEQICLEIEAFKLKLGGEYEEYYIGITNDVKRRIVESIELKEHIRNGILEPTSEIYTANAGKREIANEIEVEFQKKGMYKFNPGAKGIETSKYIYCFKIKEGGDELLLKEQQKVKIKKIVRKTFKEFVNDKLKKQKGD